MSTSYKFYNLSGLYLITYSVVHRIDVFIRRQYKDLLIVSLNFCRKEKGLELFGYVIMTNHVHLIARSKEGFELSTIIRDFKKYTSKQVLKTIEEKPKEIKPQNSSE